MDLDEILIYSSLKYIENSNKEFKFEESLTYYIKYRPYLKEF